MGVLTLSACGGGESRVAQGTRDGILQFGNDAEPENLDPHLVTGLTEHKILISLFEGLVGLSVESLEVVPGVAERWVVSEDGTIYTFHLRENARWSNGDPLVAGDFVYAWKRILTPNLGSEYAYMLHVMKGAKEYNEGTLTDFEQVGVKALDDRTLKVTLNNPTPYFLSMQIHYTWYPLNQRAVEAHGASDDPTNRWTRAGSHVGNGPFRLVEWEPNRIISTVKNEHYWDVDAVQLNGINFYPISDQLTAERSFRAGDLHFSSDVPITKVQGYLDSNSDLMKVHSIYGTYYYRINATRGPLTDVRVRKALALTMDREAITGQIMKAKQRPTGSLCPPGAGYEPRHAIEHNVEEAKRLLAEAGYPNGEGLPELRLLYNTSEDHKIVAEAFQDMWRRELGVSVTLENQEWQVYLNSTSSLDYDICRAGWYGDFLDPINFLECFVTDGGNNRTGWSDPEFDALLEQARATFDPEARFELLQQAEALLMDGAVVIPIYNYSRKILVSPDVKGWHPNPLAHVPYKELHLEASKELQLEAS
jgi:oligopeptide transport system substrate-binding protein